MRPGKPTHLVSHPAAIRHHCLLRDLTSGSVVSYGARENESLPFLQVLPVRQKRLAGTLAPYIFHHQGY